MIRQPIVNLEMGIASVQDRIREGTDNETYRDLAHVTGCNSETVRRYMTTGTPSLAFIMAVWNLSANWVLFGVGSQYQGNLSRKRFTNEDHQDQMYSKRRWVDSSGK